MLSKVYTTIQQQQRPLKQPHKRISNTNHSKNNCCKCSNNNTLTHLLLSSRLSNINPMENDVLQQQQQQQQQQHTPLQRAQHAQRGCRRTAATTLTSSKQRSSSGCKKYRRAKLLDDAISCCNDNSSNIGKPYLPAFTPTTATATVEETTKAFSESASSATHNGSTQRRRRSTAYCNLVAASSPAHLSTVLATVFGICRALSLPLCLLLLLRLTPAVRCLAVGVETANANITDLGSPGE
ncbi:unnamed protein product [Ceratitis capitata]|uniref:(Mediterranean fruit fly) hypothetical protein n=1 Tax=Ceratitis capitata TaxID=7213 RepID=A0A811UNR0_CERCA|nr:unnamed protein product [Ceratitis capitata]